jgi:predicted amidohydrolase YtcJ
VVGKYADLVLLDRDLTAIPPAMIDQAVVRLTLVGGRVAYQAKAGTAP